MLLCLKDGSDGTVVYAATFETDVADRTCYFIQSQCSDTVPTSGRVATGVPIFKSLV